MRTSLETTTNSANDDEEEEEDGDDADTWRVRAGGAGEHHESFHQLELC